MMTQPIEGREAHDVRVEVTVQAPVERAFAVFTERAHEWWPLSHGLTDTQRTDLVIEPGEGGRWAEVLPDGSECPWGQVRTWDPPGHLVLSWAIAPDFTAEADPARASTVDVRFTPDGDDRTVVTLVHSGFERHGEDWERLRQSVAGDGGWPGIMQTFAEVAAA